MIPMGNRQGNNITNDHRDLLLAQVRFELLRNWAERQRTAHVLRSGFPQFIRVYRRKHLAAEDNQGRMALDNLLNFLESAYVTRELVKPPDDFCTWRHAGDFVSYARRWQEQSIEE